jgi:DNA (cytosine-5)-methyltransferase 1
MITVGEALDDLAGLGRFRRLFAADSLDLTNEQLTALRGSQSQYVRHLNGLMEGRLDLSDRRAWDPSWLSSVGLTLHGNAVATRFRSLRQGERDEVGRLPRLDPAGQSPTLRAGTGRDHGSFTSARPVHHRSNRVITVREAARLHGFPDWFGFHATKWHGFRQVGNAVPPPLAQAVAATVVSAANRRPGRRPGILPLGDVALLEMPMGEAAERYALDPSLLPVNVRCAGASAKEAA